MGNISVADCMPLSKLLKLTAASNVYMVYEKLAIVDEYLVHHRWK